MNCQNEKNELSHLMRALSTKLTDLTQCNERLTKNGAALQRVLSELEQLDNQIDMSPKIKAVNERATIFRIATNAMINVCIIVSRSLVFIVNVVRSFLYRNLYPIFITFF